MSNAPLYMDLTKEQAGEVEKYIALGNERPDYFGHNHGRGLAPFIDSELHGANETPNILEIGYGLGGFLNQMHEKGWRTYGADVVPVLSETRPNCVVAPAWDLPFKDSMFDVVCSFDVLEHLREQDVRVAIDEMMRVLAVGGRMVHVICYGPSGSRGISGEILHPTAKPESWWKDVLSSVTGREVVKFREALSIRK